MVRNGDHSVHLALASNKGTTEEILSLLRRSKATDVQLAVAQNPSADEKTIRKLSLRKDPTVAEAARNHPRYTKATFWDHFGR